MKISYQAKRGNLYFGSISKIAGDLYKCNCLHYTCAGWIVEREMTFKITKDDFIAGEIEIPGLATDDQVSVIFLINIIEKFPDALIPD